jgi:hypothetical protein
MQSLLHTAKHLKAIRLAELAGDEAALAAAVQGLVDSPYPVPADIEPLVRFSAL